MATPVGDNAADPPVELAGGVGPLEASSAEVGRDRLEFGAGFDWADGAYCCSGPIWEVLKLTSLRLSLTPCHSTTAGNYEEHTSAFGCCLAVTLPFLAMAERYSETSNKQQQPAVLVTIGLRVRVTQATRYDR